MNNKLLWIVGIIILFEGGNYFFNKVSSEKKDETLEILITEYLKDDVLFFSELLPVFCENPEKASEIFYGFEIKDIKDEKKLNAQSKALYNVIRKLPKQLNKAKPKNLFHQKLKQELQNSFNRYPVSYSSIKKHISQEETSIQIENLGKDIYQAFIKAGVEQYFKDKFIDTKALSNELSIYEQIIAGAYFDNKKGKTDLKTVQLIVSSMHKVAFENDSYQKYFESGCLNILKNEFDKFVIKNWD